MELHIAPIYIESLIRIIVHAYITVLSRSVESSKTLLFLCVCNGSLKLLLLGFHLLLLLLFFGIRITTSGL